MAGFTHLHLHTEYSLLDGVGKISEYLDRAIELGMKSLAITDHGNMFGAIEFYKAANAKNIKPIIGIETYVAEHSMDKKEGRNFHLILLAANNAGYSNLMKISSIAYEKGFYYRPRIDKEYLKEHSNGIIALSACMQGEISQRIINKDSKEIVEKAINEYIDIFGKENFYIEVQANGIREQKEINEKLYDIALSHELKIVATNDTHYVHKGDHELQDVMMCIQTGAKLSEHNRMKIETKGLYLKSREEMIAELGEKYIPAIDESLKIADRCNISIEFGKFKFPKYDIPEGYSSIEEYLRKLVYKGLEKRYPNGVTAAVRSRTDYELEIIEKMGYSEYFVVVWDFIYYSKKKGIPIGPGRGSAAGSLVAYALGITELDPIKYNLIFERFLNPERISMPDIDIDICQERRQEVIDYVTQKYGQDRVAQIITFGTLKARAAIKDVGRVLDVPISKISMLTKLIPFNSTLQQMMDNSIEFKNLYQNDPILGKVIEISKRLENKVRHASVHAAGIVITKDPLIEMVPLYSDNRSNTMSTQYQMKELEELGILKMDFLGLRNLTILKRTTDYIKENTGEDVDLKKVPLDDKTVYTMLSNGDTSGVFQLESAGIRRILVRLRPTKFEDIIALLALYRPGPLGSGMVDDFIACKNGKAQIKYPDDSLKDILEETYGVILYQEQVMKIASRMAKYSLGEADLLRRAMGKKKFDIMKANKDKFVQRSIENGYSKEKAETIFDLIDKFAGYGFNKSHSAAYALVAYWTAYCKAKYMKYYYAAILTSGMNHVEDVAFYVADAKMHHVKLFLPDINNAGSKFIVNKDGITFSLAAIKNVGEGMARSIVKEYKENGPYKNFEDFSVRNKKYGLNKKNLEALILSGAMDKLPGNRKQKYESVDKILDLAGRINNEDPIQQMNLFGNARSPLTSFVLPETSDFSPEEKLSKEKEFLGFYFSSHPLDKYEKLIGAYKLLSIAALKEDKSQKTVNTCGIIRNIKKIVTKKTGEVMCTFTLEDYYETIPTIVFPKTYQEYAHIMMEGKTVYISGYVQSDYFNDTETKKLVVRKISFLDDLPRDDSYEAFILITNEDKDKYLRLKDILRNAPGNAKVSFAIKNGETRSVKSTSNKILPSLDLLDKIEELLGKSRIVLKQRSVLRHDKYN